MWISSISEDSSLISSFLSFNLWFYFISWLWNCSLILWIYFRKCSFRYLRVEFGAGTEAGFISLFTDLDFMCWSFLLIVFVIYWSWFEVSISFSMSSSFSLRSSEILNVWWVKGRDYESKICYRILLSLVDWLLGLKYDTVFI